MLVADGLGKYFRRALESNCFKEANNFKKKYQEILNFQYADDTSVFYKDNDANLRFLKFTLLGFKLILLAEK